MKKDYGIVKDYDGLTGKIISGEDTIIFLAQDIIGEVNNNDEVYFRKELTSDNKLRAFFVQKNIQEEKDRPMKMVMNNDRRY